MRWLKTKPTMMVGIDVTHAGPGSKIGTPSIAAVVASIDDSFAHFPCSLRIQQHAKNKEVCPVFYSCPMQKQIEISPFSCRPLMNCGTC